MIENIYFVWHDKSEPGGKPNGYINYMPQT